MNTELIGQSWDKLAPRQTEFIDAVYELLFQQHPHYKPLFSESIQREMAKMVETVAMVARVSGESEISHPRLIKLGERHSPLQLNRGDLENFKTAYLTVLKQFCPEWTTECESSWEEVFDQSLIPGMLEGLKVAKPRTPEIRDISTRTSVRNQLLGTVTEIKARMYHGEVILTLKGGETLLAILTLGSIKKLNLTVGSQAHILIRAPHLILVKADSKLKFSTANCLCGQVIDLHYARLSTEIILELKGGNVLKAIVSQDTVNDLEIKLGDKLCGVFKATNVILATET